MGDWARDKMLEIVARSTYSHGYDTQQIIREGADALRAERAKSQAMREAGGAMLLDLKEFMQHNHYNRAHLDAKDECTMPSCKKGRMHDAAWRRVTEEK